MIKKILVIAAGVLLLTATPALAGDGYADDDTVVVSDSTVVPGQEITLQASGFLPGAPVTFTMFSAPVVLGTVNAGGDGVATLVTTIPAGTAPGVHTVVAEGTGLDGQPLSVSSTIQVVGSGGAAAGGLPTTGSDSDTMTKVAIGAIAGGGLLVLLANKRRSAKTAPREAAGV